MITKQGSTKILNFITLGQGFLCKVLKMHYFCKKSSILLGIDQVYQNCESDDPQDRVLVLGHVRIVKMLNFF